MLIHIKLSKTLTKQLLKQKNKAKSIKTRVNQIQQASLLPNGIHHWTLNLIKNEIWKRNYKRTMTDDYDKRDDIVNKEDMQDGWKENEDRRHAERHDIFPEDNTVGRITICR